MWKITFKHWTSGELLERTGEIVHDNPASDRIVLKLKDGTFEDILVNTIVKKEFIIGG